MRRRAAVAVLLLLAAVGCARRGAAPAAPAHRVVLVSFDGVGADLAWGWLERGVVREPEGMRAMVEHGLAARRLRMVNPTLTAVNHVSLITGALPEDTGIVSNFFHLSGTPITETVSGFEAPIAVPTLWQAARRAGVKVAILTWPGADASSPARSGDLGVVWPPMLLRPAVVHLGRADAVTADHVPPSEDGAAPRLYHLALAAHGLAPLTLTLAAVDSSADGIPAYDRVMLLGADGAGWRALAAGDWFPVTAPAPADGRAVGPAGAWCKVLGVTRDGEVRLYRGAFHRLVAYPAAFARSLAADVGFWPGPPDDHALESWWLDPAAGIDVDTYVEQANRLADYLDRVSAFTLAHSDARLVLAYHPTVDDYEHAGLIVDRRQWAYSPGHAAAAAAGLDRMGELVDRSLARLWAGLDGEHDALVAVSDHGHMPLHDLVAAGRALADAGLVTTVDDGHRLRLAADTPLAVYGSGGCAHVYLNLAGRAPGGVVSPQEAPALLRRAARVLADLQVAGQPVVERIVTRAEAAPLGLDNPASGDLIVFLEPGFAFTGSLSGDVITPSRYYGQHGYLASHDPLCGMLFARGAGVAHQRPPEVQATAVAGRVAKLLGFPFPPPGRE